MVGGGGAARAGEHAAEGIIAKAAKSVLRDAEGAAGKSAARDAESAAARDTTRVAESDLARTAEHDGALTVGDGSRRTLDEQLADPHVHPDNAGIVEPGYDPYGGEGPEAFRANHYDEAGGWDGDGDWKWPPNDGAVDGSREFLPPDQLGDMGTIDRIGGDGGAYFSPNDTPFGQRALPPDRLNFGRRRFDLDPANPALQDGSVRIERSTIAPAFGQAGGGIQYRFIDGAGHAISTGDLINKWKIFR